MMRGMRFTARLGALLGLLALVVLPVLGLATYERVLVLRVGVPVAQVPGYRISGSANWDGAEPVGSWFIGPGAATDSTEYFQGDTDDIERTKDGVKVRVLGTFGTKVLSQRRTTVAFVEVKNGKIAVSGLPNGYSFTLTSPTTTGSRIQLFPAPAAPPGT